MKFNKKTVIALTILLFLIIVIPVSVYLVRQQQRLRTKAALDATRIEIIGSSVQDGKTTSRNVKVKLTYVPSTNPSPTPAFPSQTVNVLVLKFFPLDSTESKLDRDITGVSDDLSVIRERVDNFTLQGLNKLAEGTKYHGYKDSAAPVAISYNLLASREFLTALPVSSNEIPWKRGQGVYRPDYKKILNDFNICDYVDNREVKQIWLWGYHFGNIEPVESNMSMGRKSQPFWNHGTFGDISNSEQTDDLPVCNKTYVLYNYNFTRGIGEMLEDHGHHLESVMTFVDQSMWDAFVKPFGQSGSAVNRCGWTHVPPNGTTDYDWRNEREIQSDCEDWKPAGGGAIKTVSCHTWYGPTCLDDSGAGFKVWWMQNVPGLNNNLTYQGKYLRNWWEFYANLDLALQQGKTLTTTVLSLPSTAPSSVTTFPTHFRLANSIADLSSVREISFNGSGIEVDWQLTEEPGMKNVYAQFKVNNIWTSDVSATVELISILPPFSPSPSPSASRSPSPSPTNTSLISSPSPSPSYSLKRGDFNRDGAINSVDYSLLASNINKNIFSAETDLNQDKKVNVIDYSIFLTLMK